mmetsp:Transcript_21735/g.21491  ORF Transcript_21735/g.21491 Transcript_21735/m.21491 type:complete len:105 (+) Transcript_21735:438-752(+)
MALINEIPYVEGISESQKVVLENESTNKSLFNTNALPDEKWEYQIQDTQMEIFEEESTLPSTEDETEKLFPCTINSFNIYSPSSIGECDFTGDSDIEDLLNFDN